MTSETLKQPSFNAVLSKPFDEATREFLPHQETICIPADATVKVCLLAMEKAHLRSCMVCAAIGQEECIETSPRMGAPCCMQIRLPQCQARPDDEMIAARFKMLDMRDVLRFLIIQGQSIFDSLEFGSARNSDEGESSVISSEGECTEKECRDVIQQTLDHCAGDIANLSGKNNFKPGWMDDPLEDLIGAFKIHPRTPLFSWDPQAKILKLERIFSATDLFTLFRKGAFIQKLDDVSSEAFSEMLSQPVGNLWKSGQPDLVLDSDPLIRTLRRLVSTGFSALPIVEASSPRKTLGVISVRDFKQMLLRSHTKQILSLSTLSYVGQVRQIECLKAKFPSISVNEHVPVRTVVQKMLAADIQRIFLVDNESEITGLFSRTDLGRLVARTIKDVVAEFTHKEG